jgi:SSS family solute:Na+ symporter
VFYTLSLTISVITGWDMYAVMVVTGAVTVFYTVIGGLEAVIWTDVIQGFIKCIGIVVCIGFLLYLMPGGPSAAFDLAWKNNKFSLGRLDFDFTKSGSVWVMTLYGFFWYLQKYTADQTLVQRYLVAKTDREAIKGVALGALLCVPAWVLFMLIGTLLWAYYQLSGQSLPPEVLAEKDRIFPHFLTTKMPAGLAGLFMASLLSAAMSMVSSDLNCLSVVGVEDYYRRFRPDSTDQQRLRVGKIIVVVCGAVAVGIGIIIKRYSERVLSSYYIVTSVIAAGLAGLFLLAFLCSRANKGGATVGIVLCLIFTSYASLTNGKNPVLDLGKYNFTLHKVMIGVVGHVVLLLGGYLASFLFPAPGPESKALTLWGWLAARKLNPGTETRGVEGNGTNIPSQPKNGTTPIPRLAPGSASGGGE